ncbi:Zinc/iron permease [Sphaerosporella brunnea]|uniref:Zinc/iron permease n=1 Tax=Sphaerosporella brunnea TaxID=1250544 RepID=A0A5J5EVP6_9PEZI|nr:Zinc/iron permease [Sphaerosporella brunnea]
MNCPTRDSNPYDMDGYNQNPPLFPPELTTRASLVCGGKQDGVYNLPLHVLALFIILAVSVLACSFPLIVKKTPQLPVPHHFLFLSRHFGTGVLIATAFVHLLPTAFTSLTDPCLPSFWNQGYPAMAGLIAMVSVFVVVSIEITSNGIRPPVRTRRSGSIGHQLRRIELSTDGMVSPAVLSDSEDSRHTATYPKGDDDEDDADSDDIHRRLSSEQQQKKNLLQVMLLEAGILFHSVFIGMALSVAVGSNFIVLLIAITFHQTFEGLALGSRIAGISAFPLGSIQPWLMCLAYGTTTPIGQAIGLATRNLYDPSSQTGLLMVGIMNAISSGLLLFAGLVELLAEDFLTDESYVVLNGKRRLQACVAVAAGAAGMALVGAWA